MSCGCTTQLIGRDTSCHSSHVSLRQQLRTGGCTGDTQALGTLRHWGHSGTGPTLRHWANTQALGDTQAFGTLRH